MSVLLLIVHNMLSPFQKSIMYLNIIYHNTNIDHFVISISVFYVNWDPDPDPKEISKESVLLDSYNSPKVNMRAQIYLDFTENLPQIWGLKFISNVPQV